MTKRQQDAQILVIGGRSYVGRAVASELNGRGKAFVSTTRSSTLLKEGEIHWDPMDFRTKLPSLPNVSAIVFLATMAGLKGESPTDIFLANIQMASRVIDFANHHGGIRSLIFTSSLAVYGKSNTEKILRYNTPFLDPTGYGLSKIASEHALFNELHCDNIVIPRLPSVLGPDAPHGFIPELLRSLRSGGEIQIFNQENCFSHAVHIDDVVELILTAIGSKQQKICAPIGSAPDISLSEIVERCREFTASSSEVILKEDSRVSSSVDSTPWHTLNYTPTSMRALLEKYLHENTPM